MMGIIIFVIFVFCSFIMAFTGGLAAKPHNYVVIENTFSPEHVNDPQVTTLAKKYRKRLFQVATIYSLISLIFFLPMKDSIFMTLFFLVLYALIANFYFLQIRYIRKMHNLIVQNHWELTEAPVQMNTQTIIEKNRKIVSIWWFVAALILIIAGNVVLLSFNQGLGIIMLITMLVTWLLLIVGWYYIKRLPVRALTDDQKINQQYNDLTKFYWSSMMAGMSIGITLMIFIPMFSIYMKPSTFMIFMIVEFILMFLLIGFTLYWLLRLRKKQDALLSQTPTFRYRGDDYYWRFGLYYNPNDHRLMIPDRVGMNMGVNIGRLGGKVSMAIVGIILVVAMVGTIGPMYFLDYHPNPMTYQVETNEIILDAPFYPSKEIAYNNIENVRLVKQLPDHFIKTNGLATDHYAIGNFQDKQTKISMFVINNDQPILEIQTKQRTYYYTNKQAKKTRDAYQAILAHLP
ncbi:hypothetical protein KUA55_00950 [Enterococcus sp. ALS3]|uniref:Bacterial Pleckstrin homology domain-containing protein n=1 Tax=Enterococcus alishanensis TaxID=1303817 RepID=A0ABS6T8K6_9ENTE|nr:PH domain-containing protein [Enterococcus alishanensis]MBV7389231.1 hypothetical protein [Enterococcus alishanensis]